MRLFSRNPPPDIVVSPSGANRVEIEVHKNAGKKAKAKADEANAHLCELLEENGFTLKIYLAAGGKKTEHRGAS